jgi:glycine oxidase
MINGLYRHGFMISPAILDSTLELLESGQSNTALALGLSISNNADGIRSHEASLCA